MRYGAGVTFDDTTTGRWLIATQSSTYLMDMDARTVVRTPGQREHWPAADLRRDEQDITLLEVRGAVRVGWPMVLMLQIREDGVHTERTTTSVTAITAA